MVLEEDRWSVPETRSVRESLVVIEFPDCESRLEEEGSVLSISDRVPPLAHRLPPHEDGIEPAHVQEVDRVVGRVRAAHCAADEALDVASDEEV